MKTPSSISSPADVARAVIRTKDTDHKAERIFEASQRGPEFLAKVRDRLVGSKMSSSALANLWSLGTHVVPLMKKHGFKAKVNTVQHSIRVVFEEGTFAVRNSPVSLDVYRRLQEGTIHQPEMRRIAKENMFGERPSTEKAALLAEREKVRKRLRAINDRLKQLRGKAK